MSLVHAKGNVAIAGNLTPMIDMVFLLIVFFVLVSRIVDVERVEMDLPQPQQALTEPAGQENRIIVNVIPGLDGRALGYRVSSNQFEADRQGLAAMTEHLATMYRRRGGAAINVHVRADRSTHYQWVEPVLSAISLAARQAGASAASSTAGGPARVNLVVIQEQ